MVQLAPIASSLNGNNHMLPPSLQVSVPCLPQLPQPQLQIHWTTLSAHFSLSPTPVLIPQSVLT